MFYFVHFSVFSMRKNADVKSC